MTPLVLTTSLPGYKPNQKPDCLKIGSKLDSLLKKKFYGKSIIIRCIGMRDHPGKTLDELADIVLKTGTDKLMQPAKVLATTLGLTKEKI
jgi:hypothetical protein